MALKLNSKQQAQLAFLEPYLRQMTAMGSLIEQMATPKADDQLGRNMLRQVAASKVQAQGLGIARMADTLGQLEQTLRRTGGGMSKFRTLRDLYTSLKQAHEAAMRVAMTEHPHAEAEEPA